MICLSRFGRWRRRGREGGEGEKGVGLINFLYALSVSHTIHMLCIPSSPSFLSSPIQLADGRDDDRLRPDLSDGGRHGEVAAEEVEAEEGRNRSSRYDGHQLQKGRGK